MTKMRMDMKGDKSAGVGGLQGLFAQIWRTAVHLLSSQPARYGKRSKEFSGLCPARKFLLLPLIILHLLGDIKFTLYMGVQYNHHILVKLTFCFFLVLQNFYFLGKANKSTLLTDILLLDVCCFSLHMLECEQKCPLTCWQVKKRGQQPLKNLTVSPATPLFLIRTKANRG